jgi:hypothetical protein
MSRLRKHKTLWFILRLLFTGTILFFLARAIYTHWSQIVAFPWRFHVLPLIGSMALQLVAAVLWATTWWHMITRSDCPIRWIDGVRIYAVSNLAKYIPGSIWGYVSRAYLGEAEGLTMRGVGVSVVWEVGITIVASLLLTATTIPFYPGELPILVFRLVLVVALLCLIGLLPPVSNRWMRLIRKASQNQPFQWRDFFFYLISALATHTLVGTGFFLFSRSLVDVAGNAWWSFVGMWSFAATAGLIVILVPYGLGVKEGLLTLLLQPFLPIESATLISLASRMWTLGGELLIALLIALVFQKNKKTPSIILKDY